MQLPPPSEIKSLQLLQRLTASPPNRDSWEVGGNCNASITAARLGMRVTCIGNLGRDVYGDFMRETLKVRNEFSMPRDFCGHIDLCFRVVG